MGSCASLLKNDESVASTSLATNPTEGASTSGTTHKHFMPTTPTTTPSTTHHYHHESVRKSNDSVDGLKTFAVVGDGKEASIPQQNISTKQKMSIEIHSKMQIPVVASTGSPLHVPGVNGNDTAEGDIDETTPSLEDTRVFHSARGTFESGSPLHHHQHPLTSCRQRNSNQLTNSSSLKYSKSGDTDGQVYQDDSPPSSTRGGAGGGVANLISLMSTSGGPPSHHPHHTRPLHHQLASPIPSPSPMGDSGFSALTLPSDKNASFISGSGAGCGGWGSRCDGVFSGPTTPRTHVDLFAGCGGGGASRRGSHSSISPGPGAHPPHLSLQAQLRIAEAEFESSSQHAHNSLHTNMGSSTTPTSKMVDTIRKLSLTNRASYLTSSGGLGGGASSSRPDMSNPTISPSPSSPTHPVPPPRGSTTTALHFANNSSSTVHPPLGLTRRLSSSTSQQQVPRLWKMNRRLHNHGKNMSTTSGSTAATNNGGSTTNHVTPTGLGGFMSSTSTLALSGGGYQSVPLFLSTSPAASPSNQHSGNIHQHFNISHINNCAFSSSTSTSPPLPTTTPAVGGGFKSILPDRIAMSPTHFGQPAVDDTPSSSNRHHRSITSRGSGGGSSGYFPPISVLNSSGASVELGGRGGRSRTGGSGCYESNTLFDVTAYSSTSLRASSPQPGQRVMAALHRLTGGARFRREITCDPHGALKPAIVLESAWRGGGRESATSPTNNSSNIHGNRHRQRRHRRSSLSHQHLVASVQSMHISPLISAADLVFGHQHDSQPSMLMLDPNTVYGSSASNSTPIGSYRRETPSNNDINNKISGFTLPPAVAAPSAQDVDSDDEDDDDDGEKVVKRANLFRRGLGSSSSSSSSSSKRAEARTGILSGVGAVVNNRTDSNRTDPGANSFHTLGPRHAPRRHPHHTGDMEDATISLSTSPSPDAVHLIHLEAGGASDEEEFKRIKSTGSHKPRSHEKLKLLLQ